MPWFQGPAIGTQTYISPWNVNYDHWPKIDECSVSPGELLVAREVRSSITHYIRRKAREPYENNFWYLEQGWDEFRTGLRRWSDENTGFQRIVFDMQTDLADFDVNERTAQVTETLVQELSGDPQCRDNIDLTRLAPQYLDCADTLAQWLRVRNPKQRERAANDYEDLVNRLETPEGDTGPEPARRVRSHRPRQAERWTAGQWRETRSHPWSARGRGAGSSWE